MRVMYTTVKLLLAALLPLLVVWGASLRTHPFRFEMFVPQHGLSVVAGSKLFAQHCAGCHSVVKEAGDGGGPNLYEIGMLASQRRDGMGAAAYLLESIVDPNAFREPTSKGIMPQNIASELTGMELRNLVAYLASLGARADFDQIANLQVPDIVVPRVQQRPRIFNRDTLELAMVVFNGKGQCASCHSWHPGEMLLAPSLASVAYHERAYLEESIVEPNKVIVNGFETCKVMVDDGTVVSGRLIDETPELLTIVTSTPGKGLAVVGLEVSSIAIDDEGEQIIERSSGSLMPVGLDELLPKHEFEALIDLLSVFR